MPHDLRASFACRIGECVRRAGRVEMAIFGIEPCSDEAADIEQRIQTLRFSQLDEIERTAEGLRLRALAAEEVQLAFGAREIETSGPMHAAGGAREPFELAIQVDRVLLQGRDV